MWSVFGYWGAIMITTNSTNNICYISLGIMKKKSNILYPDRTTCGQRQRPCRAAFPLLFIVVLFGLSTVNWSWLATESILEVIRGPWNNIPPSGLPFPVLNESDVYCRSFRLNKCFKWKPQNSSNVLCTQEKKVKIKSNLKWSLSF